MLLLGAVKTENTLLSIFFVAASTGFWCQNPQLKGLIAPWTLSTTKGNNMESREKRIVFRVNKKEETKINKDVAASGLSKEVFFRKLAMGETIRPNPPHAFYDIIASATDYICYTEHIFNQLSESDSIDLIASETAKHLRDKFWDHIHAFR